MPDFQFFHNFIFMHGLSLRIQSSEMLLIYGFKFHESVTSVEFTYLKKPTIRYVLLECLASLCLDVSPH